MVTKPAQYEPRPGWVMPVWYTPSRHTKTNNLHVLHGRHPFGLLLGPEGSTCGTCAHKVYTKPGRKYYIKCDLAKRTRGPATDLRLKWRGCEKWQEAQS